MTGSAHSERSSSGFSALVLYMEEEARKHLSEDIDCETASTGSALSNITHN